ncbi:uncharacterized protein K452DRAFT_218961 [Aplosporella prunicola CBS 121167]|uniref:Uncharacterized protein n=1 Tax=Aplosporella prunicola CBS 121167 TaxID=1176127 RepID=A0A6A6BRM7_9PEZI|nr:uncharacterized protein K452DRAFT_218961 [Aplosporella prunicola CBS 121167]KAF2146746.1 hypothetical protein K452DRAFT_218961 [Aplosporella prunicola CBS 121167]
MSTPTTKYISKLRDQRVLILGGTSGIGYAVAEASIEHGASVILSGSNSTKLTNALERLRTSYPSASASGYTCDLSDAETLEGNVAALLAAATDSGTTKLNHIIFTAGDAINLVNVRDATVPAVLRMANVRFLGPLMISKLAPPYMVPGPGSSLTFTAGVNYKRPGPQWGIAAAWIAGLEGLVRGMTVDLKPLRINMVSPGAIKTEMWDRMPMPEEHRQKLFEMTAAATTVGRMGRPEDVAEAYIYLMKDQFATGSVVDSEGGRLLC